MSNEGKWSSWYNGLEVPEPYGDVTSYLIAAEFLGDCPLVADWGCGKGFFGTVCKSEYIGIDGTETPFSDLVADLTSFTYDSDGILLRHVLEHNHEWKSILDNAITSAHYKVCIILFTPLSDRTHVLTVNEQIGVPDIAFCLPDILQPLINSGATVAVSHFASETQYGQETLIKATWE